MSNIKLFTHTDLDGVGCAVLAKLVYMENVDIDYCNYNDVNDIITTYINNNINKDSNITCYITDISVSGEVAKKIDEINNNTNNQFYLFDHHPTALDLNRYSWCRVEINNAIKGVKTSGTELFFDYLKDNCDYRIDDKFDNNVSKFVEYVRDYDTWRWVELGEEGLICKQINDLMYIYGREKFIEWCIDKIWSSLDLSEQDKLVLEIKQKEIDTYVEEKNKSIVVRNVCNKRCGIVFASRNVSEVGNRLCQMNPEIDFIAMIDLEHQIVHYRSIKDDIDLGQIAKMFGGGGHPKAAGSNIRSERIDRIIIMMISSIV